MKKLLVVLGTTFALVVGTAAPAMAGIRTQVCQNWSAGGGTAKVCTAVNAHSYLFKLEGLWTATTQTIPSEGYFTVDFDYVNLVRSNGNVVKSNNADQFYILGNPSESTDWAAGCNAALAAKSRYKINYVRGGTQVQTSGWVTRTTSYVNSADC